MGKSKVEKFIESLMEHLQSVNDSNSDDDNSPRAACCMITDRGFHIHIILDNDNKVWQELLDPAGARVQLDCIDDGHTPDEIFDLLIRDHLGVRTDGPNNLSPATVRNLLRDIKQIRYN